MGEAKGLSFVPFLSLRVVWARGNDPSCLDSHAQTSESEPSTLNFMEQPQNFGAVFCIEDLYKVS